MPLPNQRNFEGALAALRIDRSGQGLQLLDGVQTVYSDSIAHLIEPIGVPRRYQTYSVANPGAGLHATVEFAAPLDAALIIEYLETDATNNTSLNVGPRVIENLIVVVDPATAFFTGTAFIAARQIVSTGNLPTASFPPFLTLPSATRFGPQDGILPIIVQPGQTFNVLALVNTSLGIDVVSREYPPRTG